MLEYEVRIRPSAQRDLDRLSEVLRQRVLDRLSRLRHDSRPSGSQKLTGLAAYRARVADYRVVYEIDDSARAITVTRVRHRRDVYRKLR